MLRMLFLVGAVLCMPQKMPEPKSGFFMPHQKQEFNPELQFDLGLLQPQYQIPPYNFMPEKPFPRVQPQVIFYQGSGSPFLLQPGVPPPGNFLVPQGGPAFGDAPHRPFFVAGYPKPAHIPPIEKDAEEVPTNPAKIPPLDRKGDKPGKIETFNEDENVASEGLPEPDRKPQFNPQIRPGQRFFILNGQPLFSNYPSVNQFYPNFENPSKTVSPFPEIVLRNAPEFSEEFPDNLVMLNQPGKYHQEDRQEISDKAILDDDRIFRIVEEGDGITHDDDSVIIDAKGQDDESESEVILAAEKVNEPTISQAQPGAIALAGPGGVAAAAPRGTAFVGKDGVAISSPQATAVAGTKKEEKDEKKKNDKNSKNES